jgi:hypothetical protein
MTDDNKHLKTFHNLKQASEYITNNVDVRGFSLRTLRNIDFDDNEGYEKNGFKLLKNDANYKQRTVMKQFSRMRLRQNQRYIPRYDADLYSLKFTPGIRGQAGITITPDNVTNFLIYVHNKVKRHVNDLENSQISIVLVADEFTTSTPYENYNTFLLTLENKLLELFDQYNEEMSFKNFYIKSFVGDGNDDIVIYKQQDMMKYKNKYDILYDIKNTITNDFYDEIKQFKHIVSPYTIKNCFFWSMVMYAINIEDVSKLIKDNTEYKKIITKYVLTNTIKDAEGILQALSRKHKRKFNAIIYFIGTKIEKINVNSNEGDDVETMYLLIKGGHTFLLNNNDNFELKEPTQHDEKNINVSMIEKKDKQKFNKKTQIYTWDMETYSNEETGKTEPYAIGVCCNHEDIEYYEFYKKNINSDIIKNFVRFINEQKHDTILYAHNGGKFDTIIIMNSLLKNFKINNYLDSHGRVINIDFYNQHGSLISFRDSYNFIASSLDSACNSFKLKTVKLSGTVKHDLININNSFKNSGALIEGKSIYDYTAQYLKNDCVSLRELLMKYNEVVSEVCKFNIFETYTNAGIARQLYLNKYYDQENKPIYYIRKDIDQELRDYYFGGRNEVFKKLGETEKKLYYNDFTSMYPYNMSKESYPYGEMNIIIPEDETKYDPDWFGFIEVLFRHKTKKVKPYHPIKYNGKLVFAYINDFTKSVITTEELKFSLEKKLGYEYKYKKVYNYVNKGPIFSKLIKDVFKLKSGAEEKGNDALKAASKTIINSAYGFWGLNFYKRDKNIIKHNTVQNTTNKDEKFINDKIEKNKNQTKYAYLTEGKLKDVIDIGEHTIYQIEDEITPNCANVGLAFFIAAYSRTELYKLMYDVEQQNGNIYYCDTDSIVTDLDIAKNKILNKKYIRTNTKLLGELTNEAAPMVTKLLLKDNIDKKEINKFISETTPYFSKLITTANKFYYLKLQFEYKGKTYTDEIKKAKGINIKSKFLNKVINKKEKTIYFQDLNTDGKYTMTEKDYSNIVDGYTLIFDTLSFRGGFKQSIMDEKGLIKLNMPKCVVKLYDKGLYDKKTGEILTHNI